MTITVKYKTQRNRWTPALLFKRDIDDVSNVVFDYSGELGTDTIDTATATVDDITAGTPSISSNTVTVAISGSQEGLSKMELKITTTGGSTLSNMIRFRSTDNYGGA